MKNTRISDRELHDMFDEALDEQGPIKIGMLEYMPSDVLRSVDPVAYRCGVADFADGLLSDGYIVEGYSNNTEQGDES